MLKKKQNQLTIITMEVFMDKNRFRVSIGDFAHQLVILCIDWRFCVLIGDFVNRLAIWLFCTQPIFRSVF